MRISDWSSDVCSSDLIGLACFAAAVGAMIATVRLDYFSAHPEQLLAPRYVVWSSLFWGGLLLATAAQARRPARVLVATVRSEEHTSELQSLMRISYAVFCLKKKT